MDHLDIEIEICWVLRGINKKRFTLSFFNFIDCGLQLANPLKLDQILFKLILPC